MRDDIQALDPVDTARAQQPVELRVAIVFTDIASSTALVLSLGDRRWWQLMDRHSRIISREFVSRRGRVLKHLGDGCLAVFNTPADAIDFAQATVAAESAHGVPIRAGVHYGPAFVTATDAIGISVHLASRLAETARPGTVLVSRETMFGLQLDNSPPFEQIRLRGFDTMVSAVRLDVVEQVILDIDSQPVEGAQPWRSFAADGAHTTGVGGRSGVRRS